MRSAGSRALRKLLGAPSSSWSPGGRGVLLAAAGAVCAGILASSAADSASSATDPAPSATGPAPLSSSPAPSATDYGAVGYVEIDDLIDRYSDRYLARVIELARAEDVDTLLVRIDTDGGEVHHARTMFKRILDLEADGIRTVAFIDFRAISAGALIAYAHEEVYLAETASVGDIGVVFQSPRGRDQVRAREVRDHGAHAAGAGGGATRLEPRAAAQDDRAQAVAVPGHPARRARWSTSSRTTSRSSSPATPASTATIRRRSSSTAGRTVSSP